MPALPAAVTSERVLARAVSRQCAIRLAGGDRRRYSCRILHQIQRRRQKVAGPDRDNEIRVETAPCQEVIEAHRIDANSVQQLCDGKGGRSWPASVEMAESRLQAQVGVQAVDAAT